MANVLDPISIVNQLRDIAASGGLPEQASPDHSELLDMAKELHSIGERKGKDDYDKRLTALANDFLPDLSVEDRGRFIGAILENDTGATKSDSWLQGSRLDKLVDNGDITTAQRQQVLEAFGTAYTAGKADNSVSVFKDKMVELLSKSEHQDQYLATFRDNANEFIESQLLRGLDGDGTAGIRAEIVKEASQLLSA